MVSGIVTIFHVGTDVGTDDKCTITGFDGKVVTTMKGLVGFVGIEFGVTKGVVNLTVNGIVGNS